MNVVRDEAHGFLKTENLVHGYKEIVEFLNKKLALARPENLRLHDRDNYHRGAISSHADDWSRPNLFSLR